MDPPPRPGASALFQVFLRLRPPHNLKKLDEHHAPERFLTVETPAIPENSSEEPVPTHITINPPTDSRKRAIEKFGFTRVFEESTTQLQIFEETGHTELIDGVVQDGRDGLLATLGVTGSGKSHTILGTKSQRGVVQLTLDYLFRSLGSRVVHPILSPSLISSLDATDPSEAQLLAASNFLDCIYGDGASTRAQSRATTPAVVKIPPSPALKASYSTKPSKTGLMHQWALLGIDSSSLQSDDCEVDSVSETTHLHASNKGEVAAQAPTTKYVSSVQLKKATSPSKAISYWNRQYIACTRTKTTPAVDRNLLNSRQEAYMPATPRRHTPAPPRPASFPTQPSLKNIKVPNAPNADFAVVVSMYEVYNDRIFDLLQTNSPPPNARGERQRRALLFKSTEGSPDRKVVAGLQKVVCGSYEEAMMVLETGLTERRVAGTGSNSVSSRSHGFFVLEVKRRDGRRGSWKGGAVTVVDLAGSERAKNSKTAGSALAEAGKINESLMYLGQCLQMQSDSGAESGGRTPGLVPFRQCKLTELLFANSPVGGNSSGRMAQKSVMLVTADPLGDFNATSQILRYSALAREITVPRIPSVASTVPFAPGPTGTNSRPGTADRLASGSNGRTSPDGSVVLGDLIAARSEAERLSDEVAILSMRLAEEQARRREVESSWVSIQDRILEVEREVREECCDEMDRRLDEEKRRWAELRDQEKDQMDEEMDRKIELLENEKLDKPAIKECELTYHYQVHEDEPPSPNSRVSELEHENARLLARIATLEREAQTASPSKKMVPKTPFKTPFKGSASAGLFGASPSKKKSGSGLFASAAGGKENQSLVDALGKLDISAGEVDLPPALAAPGSVLRSPGKKIRRLTPKERVFAEDDTLGEDEGTGLV